MYRLHFVGDGMITCVAVTMTSPGQDTKYNTKVCVVLFLSFLA